MTNLSSLTRAEQVLQKLREANGGWVDGADLANEQVGGSEGLKRLRELRDQGHDIRKRQKPNSDQFQYRLVVYEASAAIAVEESHMEGDVRVVDRARLDSVAVRAPEPAEKYEYKQDPKPTGRAHLGKTEDGKFVMVRDEPPELPGQMHAFEDLPTEGEKFTQMPGALELGRTVPCPRCGGYRRTIRERDPITNKQLKHGKVVGYEDYSRDPHKQSEICPRCNGYGVVPK